MEHLAEEITQNAAQIGKMENKKETKRNGEQKRKENIYFLKGERKET